MTPLAEPATTTLDRIRAEVGTRYFTGLYYAMRRQQVGERRPGAQGAADTQGAQGAVLAAP